MPQFPTKDHANCGMDELARAATFDVLPKATSHASIAHKPAAVRKTGQSHANRLEISDDAGGARRFPGAAGRLVEHDARHQPQLEPEARALARGAAKFLAIVIAMIMVYLLRS
jgi:hypothetical protein